MGKMEFPQLQSDKSTIFDGQWVEDKFEGRGKICYYNGDLYRGNIKDGKPDGYGMLKQGKFLGNGIEMFSPKKPRPLIKELYFRV